VRRIPSAVMLTLLLIGTLTLALNITPVNAEIYLYDIVFIEPEETQVHVGENLLVVVGFGYGFEVDPHPPIIEFSLSYDPNLLDIVHWISGWWDLTVIVEDDHMRVMVSEPPHSTDLMLITFEAKAEGDTILDLFDSNIYTSDGFVTILPPVVTATIDIDPDTLNLKSKGEWITAYVELPEGCNVSDIDRTTILLNDTIPVDPFWVDKPLESVIGDYDNDTVPDLMVKFNRTAVSEYILNHNITYGNVTLTITGEVAGTPSEGSDIIRVRMPGDVDCNGKVDIMDIVLVAVRYGESDPEPYYDMNEDGKIDILDIVIVAVNYGKTY